MSATEDPEAWDEAHLVEALAALEQLQDQMDELRSIVPNLTAPFLVPQDSPEALSRDFKQAAIAEAKRLQAFERRWKSEEVQDILAHAARSGKADSDLTKGAAVPRYGWVDMAEKQQKPAKSKEKKSRGKGIDAEDKTGASSIVPTVTAFKEAHPNFQVDDGEGRIITISFRVPSLVLTFKITCHVDSDDKASFIVECPGNGPLFSAITRCIASRQRPNHLSYLLDMIAAYTNLRVARCSKCGKLLDNTALSPAARRSKQTANADGTKKTTWEPFHEGCL
ncbi:mediator complex subunit med27 [Diplodia corticola]|uniref:Mediator complex subunit med27 n=1 Tax=Diplodia corticola TaxID=236234 RepID=A0A1J9RIQ4_9PEZI|nr:mediator complex subunit med27 [Diplodia corticola]OJD39906.1 mediator complex subunit med27 [Diplodia corticola]